MRKVLFFTTMLAFVLTSSVWAADVSGDWTVTMKSPMGQDESFDISIKAAGEKLTITGTHSQLQALEGAGTLKGDAITMDLSSGMGIKMAFTGKVAGNKMSGTREIDMSSMSAGGGQGGAPGGQQGGAPGGEQGGAPGGGQGGAPGGEQGGAPGGQQGGAPGGQQGGGEVSNAWTAVKK